MMESSPSADRHLMAHALKLAKRGLDTTDPNPRVGSVIVLDGNIIAEGWHHHAGGPHAEINALTKAGARASGATAYVTLEPCCHHGRTPPCTEALIDAGIRRVVMAMSDPNAQVAGKGIEHLKAAGIEVECGLLQEQAEALNPGYLMRMRNSRPFVRCKLAMTLDGRTATASGASKWITGQAARRDVHRLRARSSAIMTGIGTVLADDPELTVRPDEDDTAGVFRQPLRVVVDSRLRTPPRSRLLAVPGQTLVAYAEDHAEAGERLRRMGAELIHMPGPGGRVELVALMRHCAQRHLNEIQIEAGPVLSGAMLRAGLIDELVIYMAPRLLGDRARGLFHLPGLEDLGQTVEMVISEIRAVGDDWRITAAVK